MKDKKSPEAQVRERLERVRASLFLRFGEKGTKALFSGVIIALIVVIALSVVFFSIRVGEIEVAGDVTMFNEGEIIEAAEIGEGDSLFLRSSGKIERTLKKNLPLCESVEVKKSFNGRVSITVSFKSVDYYCKIDGIYYVVDENLRVLDSSDESGRYSAYGASYVRLPETRAPKLGEILVFYDTVEETDTEGETLYEVREERFYDYATEFLSSLSKSGFRPDTDAVSLEQKFDITLIYAEKFEVRFGDKSDLDVKFRMLFEIMQEGSMQYAGKVHVDLSDPSKVVARADEGIDLNEYFD